MSEALENPHFQPYRELTDTELMEAHNKASTSIWPITAYLGVMYFAYQYGGRFFWIAITIVAIILILDASLDPTIKIRELRKELHRRMK